LLSNPKKRFRKAVLLAACSGRLSADWRVANPNAESVEGAVAARSNRRVRHSREQPVELDLPDLPDSYLVATVGQAADLIEYGTSKKCDSGPDIPVLRMGNIQNGALDL
jgi:type I restriction enzyme, S subunit